MNYKFLISSLICLLITAFSLFGLRAELLPFYRDTESAKTRNGTIFDTFKLSHSYSSYSKFMALNDCLIGMQVLTPDSISIVQKHVFDTSCYQISSRIVEIMPSYSFAWYVNALASILDGNISLANASLQKSYITAPNEGWVAHLRIAFFEKNETLLANKSRDIYLADLMLLGNGTEGLQYLAHRYVTESTMKSTIVSIIETLPPDRQRKFIALTRKSMTE